MQYTLTRGEKGKVEVKVDVSRVDFDKAYSEALMELGKEVKVDGFRPGNVPVDVLESKIGTSKILNEAASHSVSVHLAEIFKKEEIIPIVNPKVAVNSLSRGEAFSFTAEVLARPKVKIASWKSIKVNKIKATEIKAEDIEKSIGNIHEAWKKQNSNKKPFDDTQGKPVTSDQEENDEEDEENKGKFIYDAQGNKVFFDDKKTLRSSSNQDSTAGLKRFSDEKKPFDSAQGDSEDGINDEFAKKIGANDLAHLRELVKKDLESIMLEQVEAKFEESIFEEIMKLAEIEVPDILIDDEVNRIMLRINQNLEQQGKKMEDFLKEENTTADAMRAKLRPQAEKNVKVTLIMDEIGKEAEIKVTKEEIDEAAKGVNTKDITPDQRVDLERYLGISIFQAKTLDLVKKTVTAA